MLCVHWPQIMRFEDGEMMGTWPLDQVPGTAATPPDIMDVWPLAVPAGPFSPAHGCLACMATVMFQCMCRERATAASLCMHLRA